MGSHIVKTKIRSKIFNYKIFHDVKTCTLHKEKYIQQTNLEHDKFVTNMEEEEVPHWMSEKGVLCHQWKIVLIAMKMDDQGAASQRISLIGRQHPTHQNYHHRGNHQKIWRQNPKLMITIRLCKMFVARGERSSILTFETSSSIWGLNVSDDTMVTWNNDNDNDDFIEMANGIKSNGWWKYVIKEHTYWHNRAQFYWAKDWDSHVGGCSSSIGCEWSLEMSWIIERQLNSSQGAQVWICTSDHDAHILFGGPCKVAQQAQFRRPIKDSSPNIYFK